ncbi:MAG: IraAB [Legionella sp.]|nr:MAG: IraAB [Legionella sp.]PJD99817.1 MAG: IraAB [Legionella sp.]
MSVFGFARSIPQFTITQKQTNNIIFITFWSQFASHALNSILILFLTRPMIEQGLGFSQVKAYAFIGVTQAMGYMMPVLGGFMADKVLGVRRAILLGSSMLALAYLLIMLSGYTIGPLEDKLFIAAYALIPATSSLLMGTASSMVSHIHADDAVKAKSAMTFFYMAINVGGLLAALIAPALLESRYGPLSVLTVTFIGKSIAALNFAKRYNLYDSVVWGKDKHPLSWSNLGYLALYLLTIYLLTLFAYSHVYSASIVITLGCMTAIFWFIKKTMTLEGNARVKQLIALILILEAVVFFVIYNQMSSTLVLLAAMNSNCHLLGMVISPAQYQMLNPLLILLIGSQLPRFYKYLPRFTIPYQFAAGTLLASMGLLVMVYAAQHATQGIIEGNYIALTYILISLAELWVSAIGLSMIGLYCDHKDIAFSMGVWYIASSLAHTLSGRIASWVAIPSSVHLAIDRLFYYENYYRAMGFCTLILGIMMWGLAIYLHKIAHRRQMALV